MSHAAADQFCEQLSALRVDDPQYAVAVVEALLAAGQAAAASDLHLQPTPEGLDIRWRVDGVLHPVAVIPPRVSANIVARLKVLSELLTYRTDVPQEGRIRGDQSGVERRVSTFPTLYGEKVVVRLFATEGRLEQLDELGLPASVSPASTSSSIGSLARETAAVSIGRLVGYRRLSNFG